VRAPRELGYAVKSRQSLQLFVHTYFELISSSTDGMSQVHCSCSASTAYCGSASRRSGVANAYALKSLTESSATTDLITEVQRGETPQSRKTTPSWAKTSFSSEGRDPRQCQPIDMERRRSTRSRPPQQPPLHDGFLMYPKYTTTPTRPSRTRIAKAARRG